MRFMQVMQVGPTENTDATEMNDVIRDERGRWAPGNPGRPLGSRNTLAARVLDTFLKDFEAHGAPALVAVREKSPIDYWRIATQLLPQQVLVNAFVQGEDTSPFAELSPDQKRAIAARLMETLASDRAKVVEHAPHDRPTCGIERSDQDKSTT
jgi:hypothetical protein